MAADGVVLALDIGTSSCRASLYDLSGNPAGDRFARVTTSPIVTAEGGAEIDPRLLLSQVFHVVDQVLSVPPAAPVIAVATATFWHSLLGLDANGQPLTPLYPWLDARSRGELVTLRQRLDERAVHARTGCVLHWTYWPAKLSWLRRTQPDLFGRVNRWVSFGEFLLQQVTGARLVSVSMASGTGLLDVHSCTWDAEVLSAVKIDADQLSPLSPLDKADAALAPVVERWPVLKGVPWLSAVGDGAASNVGAGCTAPSRVAVMIGTSGAERVIWAPSGAFKVPDGTWCYRLDERRAIVGGALNDGGSLFDWLRASLRLPSLELSEQVLAAMVPDSHGLTVLPFWGGERNPGWSDDARGAIIGLRLHTQATDILRACMEAVALRFGEIDRMLQPMLVESSEVVATGGALLHSPAWLQMIADVLDRPVLASAEVEGSSRGVSLLALETLGLLSRDKPLEHIQPTGRVRVGPIAANAERYRAAAERQRRLYDALIP